MKHQITKQDKQLSSRKILLKSLREGDITAFLPLVDLCEERNTAEDITFVEQYKKIVQEKNEMGTDYSWYTVSNVIKLLKAVSIFTRPSERKKQKELAKRIYDIIPIKEQ